MGGLPIIGQQGLGAVFLLGATVPFYEAGLRAATVLVGAAATASDAALGAYRKGVGTVHAAIAADSGLLRVNGAKARASEEMRQATENR